MKLLTETEENKFVLNESQEVGSCCPLCSGPRLVKNFDTVDMITYECGTVYEYGQLNQSVKCGRRNRGS